MSDTQALLKKRGSMLRNDVDSLLVPGEQIVGKAIISPFIYWQSVAVMIFGFLLALMVWQLGALLVFTSLIMIVYNTLKKEILLFVLTDKRILCRYGILQVDVVDMRFSKIESVELERMPTGYLMGYANLVLMGTGQRFITIPYVENGPELRQAYNRLTLGNDKDDDAAA